MKTTSILGSALFFLFSAQAQQAHFGLKGGVNISQLHFNDNTTMDSKVGVNAGVFAHIHASETWAIQPEVLYSLEGAKQKNGNSKVTYNLNYMFHNGFRLEGGPQIGFLLNAKTKTGDLTVNNTSFQSTAFSIPLGVGYLTSSGVGIDARYVFGLSNIRDAENGPTIQSNVFQLGLFYQLSDPKLHPHHR
jgi:hypothetical protein